jgi:hypothetical protein
MMNQGFFTRQPATLGLYDQSGTRRFDEARLCTYYTSLVTINSLPGIDSAYIATHLLNISTNGDNPASAASLDGMSQPCNIAAW